MDKRFEDLLDSGRWWARASCTVNFAGGALVGLVLTGGEGISFWDRVTMMLFIIVSVAVTEVFMRGKAEHLIALACAVAFREPPKSDA